MPKKIVVVNAGPRKVWNTDTLLMEAAKGKSLRGTVSVRTALPLFSMQSGKQTDLSSVLRIIFLI